MEGHGSEGSDVEAERVQIFESFAAEELSAEFVAGLGLAFDEGDAAAVAGEGNGSGGAGDTASDDEHVIAAGNGIALRGWDGRRLVSG
jgi:hypothetical protein